MMLVKCDSCGKSYKVDKKAIGKKVQCKCGHKFVAAAPSPASAPPPLPTTSEEPASSKVSNVANPPQVASAPLDSSPAPPIPDKPSAEKTPSIKSEELPATEDTAASSAPDAAFAVDSKPSTQAIAKGKNTSGKMLIIGAGGAIVIVLAVVLAVLMSNQKRDDKKTASKTSNETSNQKSSQLDSKKNTDNKKQNTKKENNRDDKKTNNVTKEKIAKVTPKSNPGQTDNRKRKSDKNSGDTNNLDTPIFLPDTTSQIDLTDWEIEADPDLAKVVKSFLMTTGKEREALAEALIRAGGLAAPFIAKEIRAVENDRKRPYSVFPLSQVMSKIGPDAIPDLLTLAKDESLEDKTRADVIRAISEMGPIAKQTIPDLIKIYHAQKAARLGGLQMSVIGAFGNMETATPEVIAILKNVLENSSGDFSFPYITVAIKTAKSMGPEAHELVPALRPYLLINQANHSREAAEALGAIGSRAGSAAEELIQLIERDDKVVTYRRYHALRDIGSTAQAAVPALVQALKDAKYDSDRANIADALGRMGSAATGALPTLNAYLKEAEEKEPDQAQRIVFKLAIARIHGDQSAAVPYLRQSLYDNTHNARSEAIIQIGTLGSDALPLVPDLAKMILDLKPKSGAVRLAIHSLGHLGKDGADGLGALITFINRQHIDPNGQKTYRLHAIDSIAWINSDDRVVTGLERIAHHDPNSNARDKARRLLMKIKAKK